MGEGGGKVGGGEGQREDIYSTFAVSHDHQLALVKANLTSCAVYVPVTVFSHSVSWYLKDCYGVSVPYSVLWLSLWILLYFF